MKPTTMTREQVLDELFEEYMGDVRLTEHDIKKIFIHGFVGLENMTDHQLTCEYKSKIGEEIIIIDN